MIDDLNSLIKELQPHFDGKVNHLSSKVSKSKTSKYLLSTHKFLRLLLIFLLTLSSLLTLSHED